MIPIQFIINSTLEAYQSQWVTEALKGGCKWIHLGISEATDEKVEPLAKQLLTLCRERGATFIIEDRPELAKSVQADGVFLHHLPQPANKVRELMGHEYIIGAQATTFEEVKSLKRLSVDYIVCPSTPTAIEFYQELQAQITKEAVRLPICAQGRFSLNEVMPIINTGIQGIALDHTQFTINNLAENLNAYLQADC